MARLRTSVVGVLIVAAVATAGEGKPMPQPTMRDLATVWVGGWPGSPEYFRLELRPDGTGLLTVVWLPNRPATAYRVTGTTLSKYRVEFALQSIDRPAESIYLRGRAIRTLLELEIGSASPKWKQDVALEPHATLLERLRAVTERAERQATGTP